MVLQMPKQNYYGLILAGGRGTRFWPRSRRAQAKQVLNVVGDNSLIQNTVERLKPLISPERIWVLTNEHLRKQICRQLPEVPSRQIIAEPEQRNTAPAIGLAAHILHSINPDAVMGVFPSDHVISNTKAYLRMLKPAFKAAEQGKIAVLGIRPRWAETGYGYIEFPKSGVLDPAQCSPVQRFREKPNTETAQEFVAAGHFFWNAGMFFWRAGTLLDSLRAYLPKTATLLAGLPRFGHREFAARMKAVFPRCENISIDFGVLEPAAAAGSVVGVPCSEFGWNDVGSWNAVYELLDRDADGNSVRSPLLATSSTGNYVDAGGKLVALLGVRDLIVVDTPDALLVADRNRAQEVGDLVKMLEKAKRHELL
jgi:mannose-1-phosphate guanylyltransferase